MENEIRYTGEFRAYTLCQKHFLLGTTTEYVRLHCRIYTGNLKNPS
jgi:hypothetical protein